MEKNKRIKNLKDEIMDLVVEYFEITHKERYEKMVREGRNLMYMEHDNQFVLVIFEG